MQDRLFGSARLHHLTLDLGQGFDLLLEEAETDPHSQGRGKCDV